VRQNVATKLVSNITSLPGGRPLK